MDFRRRKRSGWARPNDSEVQGKRLKGLDEFEKPQFVGRMARVERRRKLAYVAMLVSAILTGAVIGWAMG